MVAAKRCLEHQICIGCKLVLLKKKGGALSCAGCRLPSAVENY